jgi:polyisoprenoid-binding protein YceI
MTATQDTTAGAQTYAIDKAHSEVSFQVRHLLTKVRGRFTEFSGTVRVDDQHPENSSVTLTIDASSVDTNTPDRDQHLRSADFFHVESHPTLTFASTRITKKGRDTYELTGTLTIRGVSKEITFPVTHLGIAKDPWGNTRAGFEAATTLNRKDFGLLWNAALETGGFLVGDEVQISLSIQAVAQAAASAA